MGKVETVKVKSDDGGFIIINKADLKSDQALFKEKRAVKPSEKKRKEIAD